MTRQNETALKSGDALAEESYRQMADYLEDVLTRQLSRVRQYDLDGAMDLAEEANSLAAALGRERVLDQPAFAEQKRRIQQLYRDLNILIEIGRQEVADKLKQIRKGLKTLGVYAGK